MRGRIGAMVVACAACHGPQSELELRHLSALETPTRGLVLAEGGDMARAGMYETTCDVDSETASPGADYDARGEDDTVVAGGTSPSRGLVSVVWAGGALHVNTPDDTGGGRGLVLDGFVGAGFRGRGLVEVHGTGTECTATWRDLDLAIEDSVSLPSSTCQGGPVANSGHGLDVFVATREDITVADPGGSTPFGAGADLLAWDDTAQVLYAANRGESWVQGWEHDGTLRWEVTLGGGVRGLDDLGARGAAAVTLDTTDGGAFVVLDGQTGAVLEDLDTPSAAESVVASANGETVALVLETEVHFYALEDAE